jgi:hypothetical protein
MNEQQSPPSTSATPQVAALLPKRDDDMQTIYSLLEEAALPLGEAVQAVTYPEVYLAKGLEKLRDKIERVEDLVRQAKDLSETAWPFGDLNDEEFKS